MHSTFGVHNVHGPAKRIVSVDQVDPAGGDVTIVTVNDSSVVREVKIGGTSCSFFAISNTKIGVITPSKSVGAETIQVKFSSGVVTRSPITYWSPVDANTTLCLERGNFVGTRWYDRSGNENHFSEATYYPPETNKEPQFNRKSGLTMLTGDTNSITTADLFADSGSTYSISIMFRVRRLLPPNGTWYLSSPLFTENTGHVGLVVTDSYIRHRVFNGSEVYVEIATPPSLNEWHVLDIEADSGITRMRIDGGAWTATTDLGLPSSTAGIWSMAAAPSSDYLYGDIRAIVVSNVARGQTWFDNALTWFRVRHGFKTGASPELSSTDSDVFDVNGDCVALVRGTNLNNASDVKFGSTSSVTKPAIGSHARFDGINDQLQLDYSRTQILGNSGWTFTALVDCRDLPVDGGPTGSSTLFSENQAYVGVSVFKGGAHVWQYESTGFTIYSAAAGGVGNRLHVIQAQWTGTDIRIRVDGGEWASTSLNSIGGSNNFNIGTDYSGNAAFFEGRIVEMLFSDSVFSDAVLDSIIGGFNYSYGLNIGGIAAAEYDRTNLSLTAYFKPGNFSLGVWAGSASAGSSTGRDASNGTNPPSSVTTSAIDIKSFGDMPDFDGIDDELSTALTVTDLFGTGNFSGWVLVHPETALAAAANGAEYASDIVFGTDPNGYFVLTLSNTGKAFIRAVGSSSGGPVAISVNIHGGWNLLQWRCDGTDLFFRNNGDDWTSVTYGVMHVDGLNHTIGVGALASYSSYELNGRMAEIAFSDTDIGIKGCDDVLSYVNQHYGLNLGGYGAYDFDVTSLALTLYCRAGDYTPGTWAGTTTAGASGGRDLTEVTNYPSVALDEITVRTPALSAGSTISGVPLFDGIDDTLGGSGETSPTIESVFGISGGTSSAGSYVILFRANSAVAANAQVYANPALLVQDGGNSAGNGCSFSTAGVKFGHYDGTWDQITIPADVGEWHLAQAKWDGVNLYARVLTQGKPAGAWQSIARGPYQTTAGGYLRLGLQYDNLRWFHGVIAEVMTVDSVLSDATMDNIVRYVNQRYGMKLGHYAVSTYDPAVLALTTWYRSNGYTAGTWTGTASAGTSGAVNLGEATTAEQPASTTEQVLVPLPITVTSAEGSGRLTNAIQFANPSSLPDLVWWLHGSAGMNTLNDGTIGSWEDQSPAGDTGRDVAPTADDVPFRASAAYNGKTVVDNQQGGASRLLRANAVWSKTYPIFTISVVGHGKISGNTYYVYEDSTMYNTLIDQGGTPGMYNLGATELINGVGYTTQPRTFMLGVFNGPYSKLHVEDNAASTGNFTDTHVLGGFRGYVGSYSSDTTSYGVYALADVVAYSRVLTESEIRLIRRYRDSYYGKVLI